MGERLICTYLNWASADHSAALSFARSLWTQRMHGQRNRRSLKCLRNDMQVVVCVPLNTTDKPRALRHIMSPDGHNNDGQCAWRNTSNEVLKKSQQDCHQKRKQMANGQGNLIKAYQQSTEPTQPSIHHERGRGEDQTHCGRTKTICLILFIY